MAIEYIATKIKSALGKTLMAGFCLGTAGNILLTKPSFAYADYVDNNLETKPYLELTAAYAGYGDLDTGLDTRNKPRIKLVNDFSGIQNEFKDRGDSDFTLGETKEDPYSLGFDSEKKPSLLYRGGSYALDFCKDFTRGFLDDTKAVFLTPENWLYIGLAGGSAFAVSTQDEKINDYFEGHDWVDHGLEKFIDDGNTLTWLLLGLDAGFLAYGRIGNDSQALETGKALLNAFAIDQLSSCGLKKIVRRKRPDSESNHSFPSAHTSGCFTAASLISEMYDNKWYIWVLTHLVAGVVGLQRIDTNSHWFSDVLFAMVKGEVIGKTVAKNHKNGKEKKTGFNLSLGVNPNRDTNGIMLSYTWNGSLVESLRKDLKCLLRDVHKK